MQEEIPRFHGILRNIRGGDEGETRLFWKKAWQKTLCMGQGRVWLWLMLLLSFSFGVPSLDAVGILHNMSCCGS